MYSKLHRSLLLLALLCPAYAYAQTEAAQPATGETAATEATGAEAATAEAAVEETEADTAAPAAAGAIGAPPAGKGQVVFFREKKFVGGAIGYKVREGENELGKLSNGTYFVSVVDPGAHEYTVHSEAKDILNLEVEAGETYYVTGGVTMGVFAGRPNLSPSDQTAFDALAGKLKPAKPIKKK
ncbi:MAG: DUF2846 domain-containing protein [Pseudoxanthomonas sp.]